ncbi:hypothetical protein [Nostoc sp. 106C]|uniref:hypothetical protein n=1 Tax=Nostoc sp. 106C TaxID=1932667 RepID=UPI001412013D|nr:hypothetical protein [Nostoc sp. 106C]
MLGRHCVAWVPRVEATAVSAALARNKRHPKGLSIDIAFRDGYLEIRQAIAQYLQ